jgi:hypothetical protein
MGKIIHSNAQKSKTNRKEAQIKAGSSESSSAKRLEKWYEKSCCLHKSQKISLKFEERFREKLNFFSAEYLSKIMYLSTEKLKLKPFFPLPAY